MNLGNCNNNNQCNIIFVILLFSCGIANAFYVEGNRLYNSSNNNPILLRGIARPSLEWAANGEGLSLNDYTLMRNWGSNAVRLSLSQCFWLSTSSQYVSSYINTVDQQVTWIKSLGMAVILDLHWSDQNGAVQCAQQKMADSNSIPFWTQVATRYRNDSMILFELYNEPHDVSWNLWLNGGASGDGWNVVGMQQLYNTVRATGASNVVIVSGLNWAYDLSGLPAYQLTGYNIMYNTHPYNFAGKQMADWPSGFGFLASTYALIATEFGEFSCDATFNQHFVDYANQNAISWTGWGWYPGGCGFPALITSWDGTPSVPGAIIKYDLLNTPKVPGILPNRTTTTTGSSGSSGSNGVDVVVYGDSLQSGFQDWSWAITKNPSSTAYVHSGSYSYSFTTNLYEAVYFYKSGGISTTLFMGLEFWVNGGTAGNQNIKFNLVRYTAPTSTSFGPDNSVASYTSSGSIQANTWTRAFVDFSLFPSGSYDGFWFQDIGSVHGSTVYFDDIVLKAFPSTTATSTTSSKSATTTATSTSTTSKASTTSTTGATVGTTTTVTSATTAAATTAAATTTAKGSTTAATTAATVGTTTAKSSTTATTGATVGTTTAKSSTTGATVGAATTSTAQGSTIAATISSTSSSGVSGTTAAATTKVATTAATSKASTSSVSSTSSFSSPNNSSSTTLEATTADPTEDDGTALLSSGEKINANMLLLLLLLVSFVHIYL